jgi:uncharacterized protein YjbJ (UPF0337 family)
MEPDIMGGQWKQLKGEIKRRWGKLTDDDLTEAEGSMEKLVGRIQERYGYTKERAQQEVQELINVQP